MYVATVNYHDPDAAKLFAASLRETGFAVLTHHPVDSKLIYSAYEDWQRFFESDEKLNYRFDPRTLKGYYPPEIAEKAKGNDVLDLKEFYHFDIQDKVPGNIGPSTVQLAQALSQMGAMLLSWLQRETPAEIAQYYSEPLPQMLQNTKRTALRIIHYPPLVGNENERAIRAADHEDINFLTLLPASTAPGLQVKDRQGNWHDVPADPGNIVVNAGDMLQECSRGYYKATTHRVCNPSGSLSKQSRYSMPLFLHPHDGVVLSERYTAKSYFTERALENGVITPDVELI